MAQYAKVYMNISYNEFMMMTPYEFSVALVLTEKKNTQDETERKYRFNFDRYVAIASLNMKIKHRITDPTSYFPFYWETNEDQSVLIEDINQYDVNAMFNVNNKEDGRE